MPAMTVNDQVTTAADELYATYSEALQTYGPDVAMAGLAYMAAVAVHALEHDPRLLKFGQNAAALATGVWTDTFAKFLLAMREACDEAKKRGLN